MIYYESEVYDKCIFPPKFPGVQFFPPIGRSRLGIFYNNIYCLTNICITILAEKQFEVQGP